MVEVTQGDREAAVALSFAAMRDDQWWLHVSHDPNNIAIQAFARHREQAIAGERARVIAWARERAAGCSKAASEIGDHDDEALIAWVTRAETYDFVADEIAAAAHLETSKEPDQ